MRFESKKCIMFKNFFVLIGNNAGPIQRAHYLVRREGIDKKVTKSDTDGERWGCSQKVMSLTQNIFVYIFLKFNFSFSGSQMVLIILQRETIKLHSKCYLWL